MNKLLIVLTMVASVISYTAFAATLDERIAKVETKYEQRIQKIDNCRYTEERKELLKKHARENTDLKIKQMKELDSLKKATKKSKTNKK